MSDFKTSQPLTVYPVILSGGSGTRLWPMSRSAYPKQLLPLVSEKSLLQESAARVGDQAHFGPALVIANEEHRFIIAEQLRTIGLKPSAIMLEPLGRNTAPAAAAAALFLAEQDPNGLMLVMPSDHVILDQDAFLAAIKLGVSVAATGRLVTFGISPDRPETGYGYIKSGAALDQSGAFAVDAFVEKPDRERAETYLTAGNYTWNSGIFLFPIKTYLEELTNRLPDTVDAVRASVTNAKADLDFVRLEKAAFQSAANESIDYAVMEHTHKAAVIPVSMGWSDVGAWDALWQISAKSDSGVSSHGDVVAVDCRNSYLRSEEKLLAAYGLEDMIVVSTPDAVYVAPKSRSQEIKILIDTLKKSGRPELTHLATVHRPWGTYRSIHDGERAQVKHIMVHPGGQLSLQMHHHRAEHWIVVKGTAKVVRGNEELLLTENQSTYIPLGTTHRLENPGCIPLHLIEVQSGSYLGEDDIVRFEDNYGRV